MANNKMQYFGLVLCAVVILTAGYFIIHNIPAVPELFSFYYEKLLRYLNLKYQYLLSTAVLFSLLATFIALTIDCWALGYKNSAIYRLCHPSLTARNDILLFILSFTQLMPLISIVFSGGILYFLPKLYHQYFDLDLTVQFQSPVVQFFFLMLAEDFMQYWRHRCGHRVSWWWQLHKMHHSATEFNVITVARSHPMDLALGSLFVYVPLSLIGLDLQTFILIKVLVSIQGKLQHSMVSWRWGWVGKYLFISPIDHRIHHSCEKPHWDKNFGHITPIWDRMFGTWYDGDQVNTSVDVTANKFNQKGFVADMIIGQMEFFKYLFFRKWSFTYGVPKKKKS